MESGWVNITSGARSNRELVSTSQALQFISLKKE
jgi:hypothetical protein